MVDLHAGPHLDVLNLLPMQRFTIMSLKLRFGLLMFIMIHSNLALTTIGMDKDITGSWVGGTFSPYLTEVLLAADPGFVFPAHLTPQCGY